MRANKTNFDVLYDALMWAVIAHNFRMDNQARYSSTEIDNTADLIVDSVRDIIHAHESIGSLTR